MHEPGPGTKALDQEFICADVVAWKARVRAISDLERGVARTAHKDTGVLLVGALGLDGPARELFVAATRALPRDIAAFTGRQAELAQLMGALAETATGGGVVGIHVIGGMAGVGQNTFSGPPPPPPDAPLPAGPSSLPPAPP